MKRDRLNLIRIIAITLFFLSLVIYFFLRIYQIALDETKQNHQQLQKKIALLCVSGMGEFLSHLNEDLRLLTTTPCLQAMNKTKYQSLLADFYHIHAPSNIREIFITNEKCQLLFSLSEDISNYVLALPWDTVRVYLKGKNSVWYSKVFRKEKGQKELCYSVIFPIFRHNNNSEKISGDNLVGYFGVVASFDWLVAHYVVPLDFGNSTSTWLMDSNGRLLYHSRHPEMVLRSIKEDSTNCMSCHASFDWQKQMLFSDAAFGEYTVGDEPQKIMSHVDLQIQNERWILVVSANLSDVTAVLRNKFPLFFIVVIFILAFIVVIARHFYKMNIRRIQAEEAEKLCQQKELLHLQVCQVSKLASVGELVDGVAHELNTPLSIIMAQADALFLKMGNCQKEFREEIEIIKKQVRRVKYFTHRLLTYSKSMSFEPGKINLPRLLDECLFLLAPRFRSNGIKITKNYAPFSDPIWADYRQIEQVFINILNNAVDAIGRNGEIKLETKIRKDDDINGIEIIISDNGEGISQENLPHIFEAFFSTKSATRGTGLGLSISKAIIQRHHGKISVDSEPGIGTTFTVFLPIATKNRK